MFSLCGTATGLIVSRSRVFGVCLTYRAFLRLAAVQNAPPQRGCGHDSPLGSQRGTRRTQEHGHDYLVSKTMVMGSERVNKL